jgi:hypothetical protein
MPFQWVDPELLMEHQGIKIYHVYKDDDVELPLEFWYEAEMEDDDIVEFDVRDLPSVEGIAASYWWSSERGMRREISNGEDVHRQIIKMAIEAAVGPFARPAE